MAKSNINVSVCEPSILPSMDRKGAPAGDEGRPRRNPFDEILYASDEWLNGVLGRPKKPGLVAAAKKIHESSILPVTLMNIPSIKSSSGTPSGVRSGGTPNKKKRWRNQGLILIWLTWSEMCATQLLLLLSCRIKRETIYPWSTNTCVLSRYRISPGATNQAWKAGR